jgi:hypothetical protein
MPLEPGADEHQPDSFTPVLQYPQGLEKPYMVFMRERGGGIQNKPLRQAVSCLNCVDLFCRPGEEVIMVNSEIGHCDLPGRNPVELNDIVLTLPDIVIIQSVTLR